VSRGCVLVIAGLCGGVSRGWIFQVGVAGWCWKKVLKNFSSVECGVGGLSFSGV